MRTYKCLYLWRFKFLVTLAATVLDSIDTHGSFTRSQSSFYYHFRGLFAMQKGENLCGKNLVGAVKQREREREGGRPRELIEVRWTSGWR